MVTSTRTTETAFNGEHKHRSYFDVQRKIEDCWYGANYVNSRYLEFFWEFNFSRPFLPLILPLLVLLVGSQAASADIGYITFNVLKYVCTAIFLVAGVIGGGLQLPFDGLRWLVSLTPALIVPVLNYLPTKVALQLVQILLDFHSVLNFFGQTTLYTGFAVIFWRPMMEELQYRYLLGAFVGKRKSSFRSLRMIRTASEKLSAMVRPLSIDGTVDQINANGSETHAQTRSNKVVRNDGEKTSSLQTSNSKRLYLTSLAFAASRLGWLCASPGSLDLSYPFIQAAISPYAWTVAFVQSTVAHFSSQSLSELSPFLQRGLLLLAVQQAASTFHVAWYVFMPLYEERGLAASVGAHIAWTYGKMTWPVRVLWRVLPDRSLVPIRLTEMLARTR